MVGQRQVGGVFALVFLLTTLTCKQTTFCVLSQGKEEIGLTDSFSVSFYYYFCLLKTLSRSSAKLVGVRFSNKMLYHLNYITTLSDVCPPNVGKHYIGYSYASGTQFKYSDISLFL